MSHSLHNLYHPVHTTLASPQQDNGHHPFNFHTLTSYLKDPYYATVGLPGRTTAHGHHDIHVPTFDLRETPRAFFLEGDFPGVRDKKAVVIEKVGPRSLLVEARVGRTDLQEDWGGVIGGMEKASLNGHVDVEEPLSPAVAANDLEAGYNAPGFENANWRSERQRQQQQQQQQQQQPRQERDWLTERHVGHLQRSFTFPAAVDFEGLKARLVHGVLEIMVPKMGDEAGEERRRFEILD
jgi:HSP20 family molecular chaperone IbpA